MKNKIVYEECYEDITPENDKKLNNNSNNDNDDMAFED